VKVKLQAGAELDVLSPSEAREIVVELLERERREPTYEQARPGESAVTDANGNALINVYVVPVGRKFIVTRLIVNADGFTPGVPFKNAAGWIDVLRSNERVDFVNLANGIPAQSIDSKDTGNVFWNGEIVQVQITGGPANTSVRVDLRGLLETPPGDGRAVRRRAASHPLGALT
jgi:hypothetical protein